MVDCRNRTFYGSRTNYRFMILIFISSVICPVRNVDIIFRFLNLYFHFPFPTYYIEMSEIITQSLHIKIGSQKSKVTGSPWIFTIGNGFLGCDIKRNILICRKSVSAFDFRLIAFGFRSPAFGFRLAAFGFPVSNC